MGMMPKFQNKNDFLFLLNYGRLKHILFTPAGERERERESECELVHVSVDCIIFQIFTDCMFHCINVTIQQIYRLILKMSCIFNEFDALINLEAPLKLNREAIPTLYKCCDLVG